MLDETSALHGNMPHTTRRRTAINLVSLSPLLHDSLHQCGVRWAVHGRQAGEVRRAPRRQSRRMTMLPSTPASTNHHADLEIRNIRVAGQTNLMVDVTVRYNFKGTGHNGQIQGQLRNPDNPDHFLESAAPTRSVTRSTFIATRLDDDRPFIVLAETKPSKRHIPVWARYSPLDI